MTSLLLKRDLSCTMEVECMDATSEIDAILQQVQSELQAMLAHGETGAVTVFVGGHQLQLEANVKRKLDPVRLVKRHMPLITRVDE